MNQIKPPSELELEYDYTFLDELFAFLDQPTDEIMPIQCGYFNKIVTSLINKSKLKIAKYIFLVR